jgi:AraC family transcriptional regulator, regulatory protein of adaptative response / methylated-DNA-[protein]-cysteine methyltransferase
MSAAMTAATLDAYADDAARLAAVRGRDRAADGRFVYAVITTGVFCRPSCAARPAREENIRFYATTEEAARAGYRPCKRCRPTGPDPAEANAAAVARACRMIEEAEETPDLATLAAEAGLSRFHFHRIFKEVTGVTPRAWGAARRAERMRQGLAEAGTVTEALYGAGYGSNSRFYEQSGAILGMTATEWRDGGRDAEIRFALGECSLGSVLVAATARGVCAIQFGDDPQALLDGLQDRFPKARLVGGDPEFEALVARVVGLVERPDEPGGPALPLDLRGTAFQQRVWQALREIPVGETATYAEVAERIGRSGAARAVARACADNPVAVAVPCHRVVRTGGALAGYRWGVARKRALLEREARGA